MTLEEMAVCIANAVVQALENDEALSVILHKIDESGQSVGLSIGLTFQPKVAAQDTPTAVVKTNPNVTPEDKELFQGIINLKK